MFSQAINHAEHTAEQWSIGQPNTVTGWVGLRLCYIQHLLISLLAVRFHAYLYLEVALLVTSLLRELVLSTPEQVVHQRSPLHLLPVVLPVALFYFLLCWESTDGKVGRLRDGTKKRKKTKSVLPFLYMGR